MNTSNPRAEQIFAAALEIADSVKRRAYVEYCDEHRLNTQERLELFMQVCQAVHHAHQKGVIHRDLKPSNILVTLHEDKSVPKVIDFGIAKATQQRLTERTLFTRFNQLIGTPAYMSPEQAGMSGLDLDTRSDVYSLGVLLYELLTGQTPFSMQELMAVGYDEICRIIREKEPPKPSTRLSTLSVQERNTVAAQRRAPPDQPGRLLRGELDWIVMKCLEKDRTRRYPAANGVALDLQRHLNHEPVIARPPSQVYRLQKLVRRNRLAFVGGALVFLLLTLIAINLPNALRRPSNFAPAHLIPASVAALPAGNVLHQAYAGFPPATPATAERPRLQIEILGRRRGEPNFKHLADGDTLASEVDDYFIMARPLSAGHLYVFQVDSSGKLEWVFPRNPSSINSAGANPVHAQQTIRIPPHESPSVLYLDRTAGIEHLYAVFSAIEWPELEKTLANPTPVSAQAGSATRLAIVQEPIGLGLRGVGGTRTNSAPAALSDAFESEWAYQGKTYNLPFSNAVLESNGSFLVVKRWFKHINPP